MLGGIPMKIKMLAVASVFLSIIFIACAPSKQKIQFAASEEVETLVEVRYMQEDTVALMIGKSLYINALQVLGDLFPLKATVKDPMALERETPVVTLSSAEELVEFIGRAVPSVKNFGIVIGGNVNEQIGFDEKDAISKISEALSVTGGTQILFHEKDGELVDMKRLR